MDKLQENLLKIKDLLEKAEQPDLYNMHVKGQKIITGDKSNHVFGPAPLKEINEKFGPTQHIEKTHLLVQHKPELKKGMNNAGLGGPGAIKGGAVLPSINKLPKPGNASQAGKVKIPGQANPGKKNPVNIAEQTHNKDIKDIRMKEAHAELAMKKSDEISFADNGQWSLSKGAAPELSGTRVATEEDKKPKLHIVQERKDTRDVAETPTDPAMPYNKGTKKEQKITRNRIKNEKVKADQQYKTIRAQTKNDSDPFGLKKSEITLKERLNNIIEALDKSNYPGEYDQSDNAKRKAKNTGETTGIHSMDSIKAYGGSGPNAAAREAKEMKAKSKKMPVKVFSPEEIAEMNKPKEVALEKGKIMQGIKTAALGGAITLSGAMSPQAKASPFDDQVAAARSAFDNQASATRSAFDNQASATRSAFNNPAKTAPAVNNTKAPTIAPTEDTPEVPTVKAPKVLNNLEIEARDKYQAHPSKFSASQSLNEIRNANKQVMSNYLNNVNDPEPSTRYEDNTDQFKKDFPHVALYPEPVSKSLKERLDEIVKKTEGRTTAAPGVSEMGIEVRRSNPKSKSYSRVVSPEKHGETAKEIAKQNIKQTKEIKPKLP